MIIGTKEIPLTRGKVALVDIDDYEWLIRWKWNAHKSKCGLWTAQRRSDQNKIVYMHRQIMGLCHGDKREVDHANHNSLDNRRCNLRVCSRNQNGRNTRKQRRTTSSQYKGVGWYKPRKKWRSRISVNGKDVHLGLYKDEVLAAKAYDEAAIKYFGDFACGNFI